MQSTETASSTSECQGKAGSDRIGLASWLVSAAAAILVLLGTMQAIDAWTRKEKQEPEAAKERQTCECGSGAVCEGPRGGKYCTDGGKKRYR